MHKLTLGHCSHASKLGSLEFLREALRKEIELNEIHINNMGEISFRSFLRKGSICVIFLNLAGPIPGAIQKRFPIYGSDNYEFAFDGVSAGQIGVVSVWIGTILARDTISLRFLRLRRNL